MMNLIKKKIEYSKIFIFIFLLVIIPASGMRNGLFYLNWVLGAAIISYYTVLLFIEKKFDKKLIIIWLCMSTWLIYPLILTLFNLIVDKKLHLTKISTTFFYITLSVMVVDLLFRDEKNIKNVFLYSNIIWISINTLALILYSLNVPYFSDQSQFSGIVANRNTFSIITTILVSYIIFFKRDYKQKYNSLIYVILIISFLLVLYTLSLKGIIGYTLLILINHKNIEIKKKKIYIAIVVFIVILVSITDNPLRQRINSFIKLITAPEELRLSSSANLRAFYIREGIRTVLRFPLTGVGVDNSRYYLLSPIHAMRGLSVGTYSHNNYIELLLNGGILSFILYYLPIILLMYKLIKIRHQNNMVNYVIALCIYKLFIDLGAVTYNTIHLNYIVALSLYVYFYIIIPSRVKEEFLS